MSIEYDIKSINDIWGSEKSLYSFLEAEATILCKLICGDKTSVPPIQVMPTCFSKGLMGENARSAQYDPEEDDYLPTITLFPSALTDRQIARIALSHELIHHWEQTVKDQKRVEFYPAEVDDCIKARFRDSNRESFWRSGHSRRFIAKAAEVAKVLNAPLDKMLFY